MKPGKKGEMYSSVIKYILMAFFSLVVLVAGFQGVTFIRDRACNAELAKFELELSGIDKELRFGVKELKDFRIPCKTSQIYFFDTSKKINPNDFNSLPLMKNALATNSSKNVFVIDKGKVKKSFYAGNIEAIYPYYLCLKPKFDRISFFAEGKENSAFLTAACGQPDCTLIPINITEAEAQRIIQEAVYSQFGCDKCKYDYALENIKSTKEKVELFRRFIVCDGITKVEIVIRPQKGAEVTNFRYYEYIPKECVDDLSSYLQELELEDNVIVQKNDPLIVWHFDEIEEETILSYELSKEFGESCKRIIEGLGVVQEIQGAVPPTPVCGDELCNGLETCSTCPDDCGFCQVALLPDPCQGVLCDTPNPPSCLNQNELETFNAPGICNNGICSYSSRIVSCPGGCSNGVCRGINPCQGIVCNTPPQATCRDSYNARTYVPVPCVNGACVYNVYRDERCSDNKGACRNNRCTCESNEDSCGTYPNCVDCSSGERCMNNQCVQTTSSQPSPAPTPSPTCYPDVRKGCDDDAIYSYDNCGNPTLVYDCRRNNNPITGVVDRDDCKNGKCCFIVCVPNPFVDCCKDSSYYLRNQPPSRSGEDEDKEASLSLSYTNINYQFISGVHHYYHDRVIRESNGVGVTLTGYKVCSSRTACTQNSINARINPNGEYTHSGRDFFTNQPTASFSSKYWGVDDNGNAVETNEEPMSHPQ